MPLTSRQIVYKELSMHGTIRTQEKCPRCGQKFEGEPLRCKKCRTFPRKLYIDLHWRGSRPRLFKDQDSWPLDSWERAARFLAHIRYEIDRGIFDPRNYVGKDRAGLRFDNYYQAWLKRREEAGGLARSTLRADRIYGARYIIPAFADRNLREITPGQLEDFRDGLLKKLAPKTIQNILGILHKVFADARRRRDLVEIPEFPTVAVPEVPIRTISEEEQERILAEVPDPIHRTYFLFLMLTGCRPNEARALRWQDLDLERGTASIHNAMDLNHFRPSTKEKDWRHLPLHPVLLESLARLPRTLHTDYVFTYRGKPLVGNTVEGVWRRAAKRAGLDIGCYQGTKHSLGCRLLNAGIRKEVIQALMGHKDSKSTDRYAKFVSDSLKYWE